MDEQKRLILAVVLSVVVLMGYQVFFATPPQPGDTPRQTQDHTQDRKTEQVKTSTPSQNVSDYQVQPDAAPRQVESRKKQYRTIGVSTPLYNIAISEHGASVVSFELKNFKDTNTKDSEFKQLVPEQLDAGTLFFDLEGQSVPGLKNAVYTAKIDSNETSLFEGEKSIEFVLVTSNGVVVKKIFTDRKSVV